jgi:molybdenum-dependent DNA-binding transcriptional regulator ModE
MAGYQTIRKSINFKLNGEVAPLTQEGEDYLNEYMEEHQAIERWLNDADEQVSLDLPVPVRPDLSILGQELLQLLWPE